MVHQPQIILYYGFKYWLLHPFALFIFSRWLIWSLIREAMVGMGLLDIVNDVSDDFLTRQQLMLANMISTFLKWQSGKLLILQQDVWALEAEQVPFLWTLYTIIIYVQIFPDADSCNYSRNYGRSCQKRETSWCYTWPRCWHLHEGKIPSTHISFVVHVSL